MKIVSLNESDSSLYSEIRICEELPPYADLHFVSKEIGNPICRFLSGLLEESQLISDSNSFEDSDKEHINVWLSENVRVNDVLTFLIEHGHISDSAKIKVLERMETSYDQ